VFDDYIFEQQHIHPSWHEQFKNQMQSWYVAPVGGLNFNDNCVDVLVRPGAAIGAPAEVTLIPGRATGGESASVFAQSTGRQAASGTRMRARHCAICPARQIRQAEHQPKEGR
jgi:hypothetical protein